MFQVILVVTFPGLGGLDPMYDYEVDSFQFHKLRITLAKNLHIWKMLVGRLLSFDPGNQSGDVFIFRRAYNIATNQTF